MLGRAAPLVIAVALIAPAVQASPECLTKQEARTKWPTKPIYSHGSNRCWNDQPLSSRRPTTPPSNISDNAAKARALDLSAPRPEATETEVFVPPFIVDNSVSANLFIGAPMTGWPVLIDMNQLPDPNNGIDRCCWPSLDALKALIDAEK
jgi:hypothetical protein